MVRLTPRIHEAIITIKTSKFRSVAKEDSLQGWEIIAK